MALLICLVACGSTNTPAPTAPTPPAPATLTVTSLSVTGTECSGGICPGQAGNGLQLKATAQLSNSTSQDVTAQATWSTTNSTVATVSGGLVSFRGAGDADVIAVYQGKSDGQTMRLIPATPRTPSARAHTWSTRTLLRVGTSRSMPAAPVAGSASLVLGVRSARLSRMTSSGFSRQVIVDIAGSDLAFKTQSACGTWTQTAMSGVSRTSISPGFWLVNAPAGCLSIERLVGVLLGTSPQFQRHARWHPRQRFRFIRRPAAR